MRWRVYPVLLCWTVLATAAAASPTQVVVVEPPTWHSPSVAKAMDVFIRELESRAGESVAIVRRKPGPTENVIRSVQTGQADIAFASTLAVAAVAKSYNVFKLPFLFDDLSAVAEFQSGKGGDILRQRLEEVGLTNYALIHEGMSIVAAKGPLSSPSGLPELKGYKFATVPYNTPSADLWRKLGLSVVAARPSDVIPALQSGVVDSYLGPIAFLGPSSIARHTNVITLTRHEYIGYVLLANRGFVKRVPKSIHESIVIAAKKAQNVGNTLVSQDVSKKVMELSRAGAEFAAMKKGDLEAWRKAASVEWAEFRKHGDARLLDLALAAGTGGGNDPCGKLNECRCPDRTCNEKCCAQISFQ